MIGMLGLTGMWPAERVEGILLKTQESKAPRTAEVARPANKRLKRDPSKPIYKDEVAFELTLDEGYDGGGGGEATASECRDDSSAGLLLRREPGLEQLEKPVIRTSARVTVRHLKKFVGMKLAIPNLHDVRRPPLFFFFCVSLSLFLSCGDAAPRLSTHIITHSPPTSPSTSAGDHVPGRGAGHGTLPRVHPQNARIRGRRH